MNLEQLFEQAQADLAANAETIAKLTADAEAATALASEAEAKVATLLAEKAGLDVKVAQLEPKVAELLAENEALKAEAQNVEAKVTAAVASIGIPPVVLAHDSAAATMTESDFWAEYKSLPIEARNEFYRKNKHVLSK